MICVGEYKTHFVDNKHNINTIIKNYEIDNNHYELGLVIDGIEFIGINLYDFELKDNSSLNIAKDKFMLKKYNTNFEKVRYNYILQRCSFDIEIPISLYNIKNQCLEIGNIMLSYSLVEHNLSKNQAIFNCDNNRVYLDDIVIKKFSLTTKNKTYFSTNLCKDFETLLINIYHQCKNEYMIKCCLTCQYSDYSPYGNDDFGSMLCYKNHKDTYLQVNDKDDFFEKLFDIDDFYKKKETDYCNDYEQRLKCSGYRGYLE